MRPISPIFYAGLFLSAAVATAGGVPAVILPVTEARWLEADGLTVQDVLAREGELVWATRGPLYWRLPPDLAAGDYYVCFRVLQPRPWYNDIWNRVRHNGRLLPLHGITDPVPAGTNRLRAELCAAHAVRLAGGDVVSAHLDAGLEALVLRATAPPTNLLKIGHSSWGFEHHRPEEPIQVDVSIVAPPDASRAGKARITVVNGTGNARQGRLHWQIREFYGAQLDHGQFRGEVPPCDRQQWEIPYRMPEYSAHLLITATWEDSSGALRHTADVVTDLVAGPRPRLLLSGSWDFAEGDPLFLAPLPATNAFRPNAVTVPGYMPFHHRGRQHVGWYRKRFVMPDWLMTAERLVLCFGTVSYECDVYINGQKSGHHYGPKDAFEFDVTEVLRPGTNEILVGVRDWVAAAPEEGLRRLAPSKEFAEAAARNAFHIGVLDTVAGLQAPTWDTLGGIKDDVYLEGRPAVHVADVFVRPSVRQRSLTVDVTVANRSHQPATVTPTCVIHDRGREVLRFSGREVILAAESETNVMLQAAFPKAPLWWPHDPRLLHCRVQLPERGDTVDIRFGFREVWFEGRRFLFNGRPAKMTRVGLNPYSQGLLNRRALRQMIAALPPFGVTIAEVCNSLRMSAELSDELGLLWDLETNWVISGPTTALIQNDLYWRNAERMAAAVARTFRNHPCVVHYNHSNEFGCFAEYTNVKEGSKFAFERLFGVYEAVRAVDPTRPGHSDADGDLGGRLPDVNLHYPIDHVPGLLVQGRSFVAPVDAFNAWFVEPRPDYVPRHGDKVRTTSNGMPVQWRYGEKPVSMPEVLWTPFASLPHGGTFWKGDSVYRSTYDCYQADWERIMTLIAGHRHIEPWLVHPWTGIGAAYWSTRPICVVPLEATRNFFSGARFQRPVNIHHDRLLDGRLILRWGLTWFNREKVCGRAKLTLGTATLVRRRLTFELPEVKEPTEATLFFRLEDRQGVRELVTQDITIFPRTVALPSPTRLALWDPAGRTRPALAQLGAEVVTITNLANLPADVTVVIGEQAWDTANADDTAVPLFEFARAGGTLLVLYQTNWPKWSPAGVRLDPQNVSSRVWKRAPSAPVFRGIADAWLRDWHPDHVVSSHDFVKPLRGNVVTLADSGVRDGLERACLLEMRYGQGRIVGCQMRLIEALAVEPVASRMLANLLAAATLPSLPPVAAALHAETASPVAELLHMLGADITNLPHHWEAADLRGRAVVLAQLDATLTAAHAQALRRHAEQGALIWLRGATANTLPLLATVSGVAWEDAGQPLELWQGRGLIAGAPPELAGLSNAEFYWKRGQFGDQHGLERPGWKLADIARTYVRPGTGAARCLVQPNLMWVVDVGQGRVLVDQVLWAEKVGEVRDRCLRIASVMLTQAGVSLRPAARMAELPSTVDWIPVDLSPYGRFGFTDDVEGDGQGGWTDQGPLMDMRRLGTGTQRFNSVTFYLHPEKGCLTMRGQHQRARDAIPQHYLGIPIGRHVAAIELLHSGAWVAGGVEVFKMVVNYEDGTKRAVPFIGGINTRDWTSPDGPFPLEMETQTRCAWSYRCDVFEHASIWQSRWINPEPAKKIVSIDFVHDDITSVGIVCGLTLGVDLAGVGDEQDPRGPEELLAAAQKARTAGNLTEAVQLAERLCRKAPGLTENWNLLGELRLTQKDYRKALEAFRRSLDVQPNQPEIMVKVQQLHETLSQQP